MQFRVLLLSIMGIMLISCGGGSSDQWYDYGNGMINLANVSNIRGKINLAYSGAYDREKGEYICPNSKGEDWNNPLTEEGIIIVFLLLPVEGSKCYKNIRVSAFIMFDLFKLELYSFQKTNKITKQDIKKIKNNLENSLSRYQSIF